jgi:hypothetical protein
MPSLNAKDILEGNGFFIGMTHSVGGLFLESINSTNTRHQSITNIHQHGTREEEGANAKEGHNPDQVDDNWMEGTVLIRAKKVVPAKQAQGIGGTRPSVQEKEKKVLQVAGPHTIVHPWTMMVHSTDAAIADSTMMRHGGFEGLTLSAHGVRILHEPLTFRRNSGQRHTSRIRQGSLGVTGQSHKTQDVVNHAQDDRNSFCDCQEGDSGSRIHQ